ncbi:MULTISPECIES: PFL family protein [Desulfosediminicola]|uniref:PFL family protein n=1 Tax=Desulfosediminicola TaxID=2886823 RepID=UPI0010ABECAF|nr:PFL family protein [Desulfosediminicola ganghwensis]
MLRSDQILATVEMIQKENLDVRTVTMGINLLDCRGTDVEDTCRKVEEKIVRFAGNFVATCNEISRNLGIPIVNKRISVTPIAFVGSGFDQHGFVELAKALDRAATAVGVDILGGFSAQVEKGMTATDHEYVKSLPEALAQTDKICASINIGTSQKGINMDALAMMGPTIKEIAEKTKEQNGFGAAKFVVFCNQPGDNPFMAGAIHGLEEADVVLNVGVSGPGVIARSLERLIEDHNGTKPLPLDEIAEEIKQTTFRVTRCGELVGRQVSKALGIEFGVVDLSLAPTPAIGDSVGEIFKILGVDAVGAPGSTAILAMLNDAVKKGGIFASKNVGGLSGAFIPVMEDSVLADAVGEGALCMEKLEAMTCVCSVGLDMVPIPGSTDADTISAIIADEMALGMINNKTTAARLIPVPGMEAGDHVSFGGLFGASPIMELRNTGKSSRFIGWGGRIPAPIHSFKN